MCILNSAPNHPPLKYRCPIKISNQIKPTYFNSLNVQPSGRDVQLD